MNNLRSDLSSSALRLGAAAVVVVALAAGVTWRGLAADTTANAATPQALTAQAAPQISRAALGGRDTYADVVKTAAPAVVTIRTEGRARMSATGFDDENENEDFFRRFFGP